MKVCTKCGVEKPIDEFHRRARAKDGRQTRCKLCQRADTYAWRDQNPDRYRAIAARSYARVGQHRQRERLYGLSQANFEAAVRAQAGVCAICQDPPDRDVLDVDHDHLTGQIRGLLCRACNTALGKFRDSPELLATAIAYLDRADSARP